MGAFGGGTSYDEIVRAAYLHDFSGMPNFDDDNAAAILTNMNTNLANLQATSQTNALNLKLAREQNAFNRKQWEDTNAYNDPSAQKERYLAAGINPITAMSNGGSNVAASNFQSADLANQQTPSFTAPSLFASIPNIVGALTSVANSGKGLADSMISLGNLENTKRSTDSEVVLNRYKALSLFEDSRNKAAQTDSVIPSTIATNISEILKKEAEIKKMNKDNEKTQSEIELNEELKKSTRQQIIKSQADIDLGYKQLNLGYYQADSSRMSSITGSLTKVLDNPLSTVKDAADAVGSFVKSLKGMSLTDALKTCYSGLKQAGKAVVSSGSTIAMDVWNDLSSVYADYEQQIRQKYKDDYARKINNRSNQSGTMGVVNPSGF